MAIEEVRKNKSAKRPNFHKGSLSHSPSQTNGDAKVQINSEIAIPKLQKLAETYLGVSDPHRFLTDLRVALGIPDSQGASKYGVVSIPKEDGSILQASLRVTNHQANANTYIDHDANYKYNLSIVVRRKQRKNTFMPNENVILDEYVYYGTKMQDIENPLTQIVNGIIVFLQSGEYKDTTGIAFKNQSVKLKDRVPQNISVDKDGNYVSANAWGADYVSENKQYNTNKNMNKKQIRLTENDLKQIVKESVNKILNEADGFKQVNNLNDYVASNGLQMKPASKFQRVNAQSGKSYINQYGKQNGMDKRQIGRMVRKGGAPLTTVAGDGTQETNNMVTKNHTVLNNVGNTSNKWAAETPTFKRKYEQDPSNRGTYKPKGGPMNAAQINEPISFTAPWGEKMNVDKGGYILQDPNNPNDIYGISGKDFDSTYRFNEGKNRIRMSETQLRQIIKESIEQVLNEVSPEYYTNAANKAQKSINGFKGKMMKTFMPKQYNKRQRQATQFSDMSNDHPQDEWEITNQQMGSNPYDAQTYYTLRNTRTGEQRGYNDGNKEKPFRGRVIAGQGGDNESASYLNNNQYNQPRR